MHKQIFRTWHRRIGIFSLLMILWLAFSGALINHGDALGLNKNKINITWINKLYGLDDVLITPQAILINEDYFFCFQGDLYRNAIALSSCDSDFISGIRKENQTLLMSDVELVVLDEQYLIADRIPFSLLSKNFNQVVNIDKQVVLVETPSLQYWQFDLLSLQLKLMDVAVEKIDNTIENNGSENLRALPASLKEQLDFPGISLERMLLDAHSGRLFGSFGVLVVDFFALCFVLLGLSGLWIFLKKQR